MKSKRNLMTALIGLAMLATPITAAAKDHKGGYQSDVRASQSRSYNAPARSYATARVVAPAVVTRREFRAQRGYGSWTPAQVGANPGWRENKYEYKAWKHGWPDGDGDADDYQNYGNRGYYGTPAYQGAAPYYGTPGYGYAGGACDAARRIRNTYVRDRNTGHPAAASDLLPRLRRAEQACGGVPYGGGGGGLLGGLAGVPAYQNYGGYGGYNNPNYGGGGLLGGLLGGGYNQRGYNQPYGYSGYNQPYGYNGYNQPYGNGYGASSLAPLLQQFVH